MLGSALPESNGLSLLWSGRFQGSLGTQGLGYPQNLRALCFSPSLYIVSIQSLLWVLRPGLALPVAGGSLVPVLGDSFNIGCC